MQLQVDLLFAQPQPMDLQQVDPLRQYRFVEQHLDATALGVVADPHASDRLQQPEQAATGPGLGAAGHRVVGRPLVGLAREAAEQFR